MIDAFLWITEDPKRDRALIKGRNVKRILELARVDKRAAWSRGGKGYVIGTKDIPDVCAWADYTNTPYRWRLREPGGAK